MKDQKLTLAAAILVAAAGIWGMQALNAQQPGFTRVELQDKDMSVQSRRAVQARADFTPGGAIDKHTHPGEEISYVLEGTLELQVEGEPPRILKAGEVFFIPAGVVHAGKNVDKGTTKVLATYVVEKGKPVATMVQ